MRRENGSNRTLWRFVPLLILAGFAAYTMWDAHRLDRAVTRRRYTAAAATAVESIQLSLAAHKLACLVVSPGVPPTLTIVFDSPSETEREMLLELVSGAYLSVLNEKSLPLAEEGGLFSKLYEDGDCQNVNAVENPAFTRLSGK